MVACINAIVDGGGLPVRSRRGHDGEISVLA
jgi:hypothetical protein